MTKGELSEFVGSTQKQIRNKVRRSLQTLQVSADEQVLSGKNMIHQDEEMVPSKKKQSKAVEKIIVAEKENDLAPRRSKRRTAISSLINYTESPDDPKTSKSVSVKTKSKKTAIKPKKGRPTTVKKNNPGISLNQTKLNFSAMIFGVNDKNQDVFESADTEKDVLVTSPPSDITEDSGFGPNNGVCSQSPVHTAAVSESHEKANCTIIPDNDTSILTSANPSLNYWKDLAEQRRIALEQALHENELIHDQLTVLEAENSQLKQLLKEAEHLAEVVRNIVE